ncbi:MAG TPA: hypothetical protein GXX28_01840 [Firmicutes bacterium]|nr:hypothetical protein [Bacillota bacterium]
MRRNQKSRARRGYRLLHVVPRETTAPDSLIGRVGAEGTDLNAAPLKSELTEDAADTKD